MNTKSYYPSLVGVGLLADSQYITLYHFYVLFIVLPDLPLPTYIPTPLESTIRGCEELKTETNRLLNTSDPQLCTQITKALSSVDTSFL